MQTMTRHALTENFDNRDVALGKGELVIILENERSGDRGFGVGDRYHGGLERVGGYHHVMVKTRHGRKVRIPRHILSKEIVVFKCQLCFHPPISTYREYVDHMIDKHLRVQLLKGLDMTKKQPTCPFPSCHGMAWPIVDNLLFHYASHHNVLEKVVMYESEVAATDLREVIKGKENTIEDLVKEIGDMKNTESGKSNGSEERTAEMRGVIEQMIKEMDGLKQKIVSKNTMIKSLKDELIEARRSFKSCEERYEDVVKFNLSIQNELNNVQNERKTLTDDVPSQGDVAENKSNESCSSREMSDFQAKGVHETCGDKPNEVENDVTSTGETSSNCSKSNQTVSTTINQEEMYDDLRRKVERLSDQNEAWQKQNDNLQLEIENMHMQNENLKNIIEIGKSTVETAKKISQDLAEENKDMKLKESKNLNYLKKLESDLNQIKTENQNLAAKYNELHFTFKTQASSLNKMQGEIDCKAAEINQLQTQNVSNAAAATKEDPKGNEKNHKLIGELKLMGSVKEDLKSKLIKCRENCRNIEESKRSLDRDYKALIVENRSAANEIKTLKNHLSSNRAIIVERAVAKDEIMNLKTELASKNVDLDKSSIKLKKVSTELNAVLGELKQMKEAKVSVENEVKVLKDKLRKMAAPVEIDAKQAKLNEEELGTLRAENSKLKDSKQELQERMDFYVSQCSEFEKNDSQLQEEISILQKSIKKSTTEHAAQVDDLQNAVRSLNESLVFYKDQEEVLIDENEKMKEEVIATRVRVEREIVNEDLIHKYNLKCEMVEELLKKHEKIAAQLRRKDWEIDNYQKKLDSAFEAQSLAFSHDLPTLAIPGEIGQAVPAEARSPVALDLSMKEKAITREQNNNEVKDEMMMSGPSGVSLKRKFSECSSASQSLDDSNPTSLHENLDASFDSTSTCPSEAAILATNHVSGFVMARKRTKSVGGSDPKKIPYVSLEDD